MTGFPDDESRARSLAEGADDYFTKPAAVEMLLHSIRERLLQIPEMTSKSVMSAIHRDKARFHRKRKARIARRARNRQRLESAQGEVASVVGSEKKGVTA